MASSMRPSWRILAHRYETAALRASRVALERCVAHSHALEGVDINSASSATRSGIVDEPASQHGHFNTCKPAFLQPAAVVQPGRLYLLDDMPRLVAGVPTMKTAPP